MVECLLKVGSHVGKVELGHILRKHQIDKESSLALYDDDIILLNCLFTDLSSQKVTLVYFAFFAILERDTLLAAIHYAFLAFLVIIHIEPWLT